METVSDRPLTTVSVSLCAYNGQAFIEEQLDSLLAQTHLPDEVVIFDDGSKDETCAILKRFSRRAPFPVELYRNQQRLGPAANFAKAFTQCTSDVIVPCDQDDIWLPSKLCSLLSSLEKNPNGVAAFSDAWVVDAGLKPLGYTMWQQVGFTPVRQRLLVDDRPWDVLFKDPVVTGATLMFRRDLLPYVLPIPGGWMHDAWVAQVAASQGRLVSVDEPLILYRQHDCNVIGGKKLPLFLQFHLAEALGRKGLVSRELKRYTELRNRLASFPATPRRDVMLKMAEAKLEHLNRRYTLPPSRLLRWPTVLTEWLNGNYARFAKDWRNVVADLFMS